MPEIRPVVRTTPSWRPKYEQKPPNAPAGPSKLAWMPGTPWTSLAARVSAVDCRVAPCELSEITPLFPRQRDGSAAIFGGIVKGLSSPLVRCTGGIVKDWRNTGAELFEGHIEHGAVVGWQLPQPLKAAGMLL